MKKIFKPSMPCTLKPKYLLLLTTIAGVNPAMAALSCNSLNGVWQGQLGKFTNVNLTITPVSTNSPTKISHIRYADAQFPTKNFDLPSANCQVNSDKSISIKFYRNSNGVEINLWLVMRDEVNLQVPTYSIRENNKYYKIDGWLKQ